MIWLLPTCLIIFLSRSRLTSRSFLPMGEVKLPTILLWLNLRLTGLTLIYKYQVLTKGSSVHTDHVKDNCDLVFAVENLTATLNKAANDSCLVPPKKPKKSKKGLDIWTPEIAHLAKNNKEKHGVWIELALLDLQTTLPSLIWRKQKLRSDPQLEELERLREKGTMMRLWKLLRMTNCCSTS